MPKTKAEQIVDNLSQCGHLLFDDGNGTKSSTRIISIINKILNEPDTPEPKFKVGDGVKAFACMFNIKKREHNECGWRYLGENGWVAEQFLELAPLTIADANPCPFCGEKMGIGHLGHARYLHCTKNGLCYYKSPARPTTHEAVLVHNRVRLGADK